LMGRTGRGAPGGPFVNRRPPPAIRGRQNRRGWPVVLFAGGGPRWAFVAGRVIGSGQRRKFRELPFAPQSRLNFSSTRAQGPAPPIAAAAAGSTLSAAPGACGPVNSTSPVGKNQARTLDPPSSYGRVRSAPGGREATSAALRRHRLDQGSSQTHRARGGRR